MWHQGDLFHKSRIFKLRTNPMAGSTRTRDCCPFNNVKAYLKIIIIYFKDSFYLDLINNFGFACLFGNRHRQPEVWWTDTANYSNWAEEIIGMREILISNAGGTSANAVLTRDNIVGMRAPYIRPGLINNTGSDLHLKKTFSSLFHSTPLSPF